ncbi:MAG: 4Fe-4S dicluster domain-containing protein [Actinomycetota bacterium]
MNDGARPEKGLDRPADPSRRALLKGVGLAAGAAGLSSVLPLGATRALASEEELAKKHAEDPGLLIDVSKCVGCGSCAAACKLKNKLESREDQPFIGPKAKLASSNYTVLRQVKVGSAANPKTRFVKDQCLHCMEPACAAACFAKALTKTPGGPVRYDASMCVGCRYCMLACPFHIPTYEWERVVLPRVSKCNLCEDRVTKGEPTACASACSYGAITFGKRAELLKEAHSRIAKVPAVYHPHVYGETEAGGGSVFYLADASFEQLGFRDNAPDKPIPAIAETLSRPVPYVAVGGLALLSGIYALRKRRGTEEGED